MKARFSKSLAFVGAFTLALAVAACGGSSKSSTGQGTGQAAAQGSGKVTGTITVWDLNYKSFPGYTKAANQLDAEFAAQNPGVKINHVAQPFPKYDEILQAAFTGHTGPDVMMLVPGAQGILRWTQGLTPLNDKITSAMKSDLSGWNAITPGFTSSGTEYGVPIGEQGEVFYYNKKIFKKAGLSDNFKPTSWQDVITAGKKIKAAGYDAFCGGDKEGFENQWWFTVGWMTSNTQQQAIDLATGKMPFTNPAVANAFAPEEMVQKAGLFRSDRFTTPLFPNGAAQFGQGRCGMFLGLWSTAGYYGQYIPTLGANGFGVFLPPGNKYVSGAPEWVWSIPQFAQNKDAAWAYIKFLASHASAEMLYKVGGVLPNDSTVQPSPTAPPQEKALISYIQSAHGSVFPDVHQMIPGKVLTELSTDINQVLQGRMTMSSAQSDLQKAEQTG